MENLEDEIEDDNLNLAIHEFTHAIHFYYFYLHIPIWIDFVLGNEQYPFDCPAANYQPDQNTRVTKLISSSVFQSFP